MKIKSIHFSDSLNLKGVKANLGVITPSTETISELFYNTGKDKYLSFYNYGAASFINYTDSEINTILDQVKGHSENIRNRESDEIEITFSTDIAIDKMELKKDMFIVPADLKDNNNLLRIVMFDLSQSVSMDDYSKIAERLLLDVKKFSAELANKGKISISGKSMKKFIGMSLTTKNNIVDDLYIFDSPDIAWDDERLDKVHKFLTHSLDLENRFKELEYTFKVVDDNLVLFKELYEHRETRTLEIVVIILILIEVIKAFVGK
jgi:uncharacterized Rmd1/YagE family protein